MSGGSSKKKGKTREEEDPVRCQIGNGFPSLARSIVNGHKEMFAFRRIKNGFVSSRAV
jgi:hypothetical protein